MKEGHEGRLKERMWKERRSRRKESHEGRKDTKEEGRREGGSAQR
jgi:hypothetical protein